MAFDFAGHVNLCDVTVHSGVLVLAIVNDSRAESLTDSGVGAGQRVIEANPERYVVWNMEALR
jgi:hypothetical protein